MLLLQVVANASFPKEARLAAALFFKNQVERRWKPSVCTFQDLICFDLTVRANNPPQDDTPYTPIPPQDKATIKQHLIELMLAQDISIGKVLSAALQTISKHDFPHDWNNLLPEMVARLNTTDFNVINGVMRTLNYVFKR